MKKCELLVPAGAGAQFTAAVENGADAVYIGGPMFNARIGAGNFTIEEMEKAIDYAHLRGVKVYVTMNTLVEDEELEAALGFAEMLYEIGADALIIQDIGLGKVIHEKMPDFPLHLSTQATVYNRRGLEAAKMLGYERAVLARELTLSEILNCSRPEIIETEVFVHGALCFCYSGQCQMSRYIGGRSGNKGRCAQPCRLPYTYLDETGKKLSREEVGEYPLSPRDLCMIERLGELVDAGVSSLKIEGRMKSPEYVAVVTSIYRKYLDEYYRKGRYKVSDDDMYKLMQIFNRGGFTEGYADGNPGEKLMAGRISKNQGIYCGTVKKMSRNGLLADIELSSGEDGIGGAAVEPGDVIEIHGRDVFSVKVTYHEKIAKNIVRIGDFKGEASEGDKVYRIISQKLMKSAADSFAGAEYAGGNSLRKLPVSMVFKAEVGKPAVLTASACGCGGERISCQSVSDFCCSAALSRPLSEEEVKLRVGKTGETPFEAEKIKVILNGELFIPVAAVNSLRRNVLEELENKIKASYKRTLTYEDGERKSEISVHAQGVADVEQKAANQLEGQFKNQPEKQSERQRKIELYFDSVAAFTRMLSEISEESLLSELEKIGVSSDDVRFLLPLRDMTKNMLAVLMLSETVSEKIIPYISNVTKGSYDEWLEDNLDGAAEMLRNYGGGVYIGNIGWIKPFADRNVSVYGDFGLNITNRQSALAYEGLGMDKGNIALSLEKNSDEAGAFPLMITEHEMRDGILVDRKGAQYQVRYDRENGKTIIRSNSDSYDFPAAEKLWKNTKKTVRFYV